MIKAEFDIRKEIIRLNSSKVSHDSDILAKLLRNIYDLYWCIALCFRQFFGKCYIPMMPYAVLILKAGDAIPVFKKDNTADENF